MSKLRLIAMLMAFSLVAVACAGTEDSGTQETTATTMSAVEEAAEAGTDEPVEEPMDEEPAEEPMEEDLLEGTTVTVLGPESSDEEAGAIIAALKEFGDANGIRIQYTGARDAADLINTQVAGGNPPDIFVFPQPGKLADFARNGDLIALPADVEASVAWSEAWTTFGNVDGTQFGIPVKADLKSLVWYQPGNFEAGGYTVPESFDELVTLTNDMIANGDTPWCVGIESGPATGWPFTDWVEDMVLRQHGADVYDQWVAHDIDFADARIQETFETVLGLWNTPGAVFANDGTIAATPFGNNAEPLVAGDCFMHRQASFFAAFMPDGTTFADPSDPAAVDVFYFPSVSGDRPVLGAGTLVGAFRDAPEVWATMQYFGGPEYAEARQTVQTELKDGGLSGFLSAAEGQDPSVYQGLELSFLDILATAEVVRFDGSDLMPAAVGSGTFWTESTSYINGEQSVEDTLSAIDASWP